MSSFIITYKAVCRTSLTTLCKLKIFKCITILKQNYALLEYITIAIKVSKHDCIKVISCDWFTVALFQKYKPHETCIYCTLAPSLVAHGVLSYLEAHSIHWEMAVSLPKLYKASTALLCVDLQKCYYKEPVTTNFPNLEQVLSQLLCSGLYSKLDKRWI